MKKFHRSRKDVHHVAAYVGIAVHVHVCMQVGQGRMLQWN